MVCGFFMLAGTIIKMVQSVLQISAGHRTITAILWPLTAHLYHVMITVTSGFTKKRFLLILFFIPRNSFERS